MLREAANGRLRLSVEIRIGTWGVKVRPERVEQLQDGKAASQDLEDRVTPVAAGIYEFIAPALDTVDGAPFLRVDGPLIRDPEDGSVYQLQKRWADEPDVPEDLPLTDVETDPSNYYPADDWPDGCTLGVLRSELDAVFSPALPAVTEPVKVDGASVHFDRQDLLAPMLADAVSQLGSDDTARVFAQLREWAKARRPPLLGVTDRGLQWVDSNDEARELTRKALGDRLRRLRGKAR